MKFKIMSIFSILLCVCFSIILCGCGPISNGIYDKLNYNNTVQYLNNYKVATNTNNEDVAEQILYQVEKVACNILNSVKEQYVDFGYMFGASDYHKYASRQDAWLWESDDFIINEEEITSDCDEMLLLEYQILSILANSTMLDITPNTLAFETSKENGTFSEENLLNLAMQSSHSGFFYYDADPIAEYLLQNMIGDTAISNDNLKFIDNTVSDNGSKSFDFYEINYNLGNEEVTYTQHVYNNIISDFLNTNNRATDVERSDEWNSINWGELEVDNDAEFVDYVFNNHTGKDQRINIVGINGNNEFVYNIFYDYKINEGHDLSTEETNQIYAYVSNLLDKRDMSSSQVYLDNFAQTGDISELVDCSYSGFKNYTNIIYYSVYDAISNFTVDVDDEYFADYLLFANSSEQGEGSLISYNVSLFDENLTKPNITTNILNKESLVINNFNEDNNIFNLDYDTYKSILISANSNISINDIIMIFETEQAVNENITIEINARYNKKINSTTFETIETTLGNLVIKPGLFDYMSDDNIFNYNHSNITNNEDLAENNITNFELSSFINSTENNQFKDNYYANESESLINSKLKYINETSEFLELQFNIQGTQNQDIKFRFAFVALV